MTTSARLAAAVAGLLVDRAVGEPPARVHPVALAGLGLGRLEQRWYADDRLRGAALTGCGVLGAVGLGAVLTAAVGGTLATGLAVEVATAGRMLAGTAREVGTALEAGHLDRARALVPALVGRDPSGLDAGELARAVVESVAENTVDAVVAPVLWGAAAGAPGVLAHRVANTLDAMVGHRSPRYERFGWASARLDDVLAFVPARTTAALVVAVRPSRAAAVLRAVRVDAPAHPSPNAGVAEAAFAAALGVRLGGTNRYGEHVEVRPGLGTGRSPDPADVERAVRLSLDVGTALAAGLACAAAVARLAPGVRRRRAASWPSGA